jgi:hypothetical protein
MASGTATSRKCSSSAEVSLSGLLAAYSSALAKIFMFQVFGEA